MTDQHPSHARTSRSPDREHRQGRLTREPRSRSPHRHRRRSDDRRTRRHHHHDERADKSRQLANATLPMNARPLSKNDLSRYKPMFALYLDIQKQKYIEDLDEQEVRGRWKSFVGKWNRGELAEGWYDPATLQKAKDENYEVTADENIYSHQSGQAAGEKEEESRDNRSDEEDEENEDDYGPKLLAYSSGRHSGRSTGPSIPNMQDLELRREARSESAEAARRDMRAARAADRKIQKERLEDLVPRAEAGTRERQLEKKRDLTESNRAFARAREGSPLALADSDLMGGNEDSVESLRAQKQVMERQKNERELRREEILRARIAEREERVAEYRAKEDKTMDMLKALAKERFG